MEDKPNGKPGVAGRLAGEKPNGWEKRVFPVTSLADVLREIHRAGGTGRLEIHFKDGQARGEARWLGRPRSEQA